jgi:hypothetical protein
MALLVYFTVTLFPSKSFILDIVDIKEYLPLSLPNFDISAHNASYGLPHLLKYSLDL